MFRPFVLGIALACGLPTQGGGLAGQESGQSRGMTFATTPLDGRKMLVSVHGAIATGDAARFSTLVESLAGRTVVGLVVDSPGGDLIDAELMADMIRDGDMSVAVVDGATCASSCFLLFAAATLRFATPDARIGVHSASCGNNEEDVRTLAATTAMARDAHSYGVPNEIIGRMVTTRPGAVAWLSPAELAAMDVHGLAGRRGAAPARGSRP